MIRHPKKRAYLAALEATGAKVASADAAGIDRHTPAEWRAKDEQFAEAERMALEAFADRLEVEAVRRAHAGVLRKRFHGREPILDPETGQQYAEREYDSTLLMFLLKAARPGKYRERIDHQHVGADGAAIVFKRIKTVNEPPADDRTTSDPGRVC